MQDKYHKYKWEHIHVFFLLHTINRIDTFQTLHATGMDLQDIILIAKNRQLISLTAQ